MKEKKKESTRNNVSEKSVRHGNDVTVYVNDRPSRFYSFSDPYTAQMFCRMTNKKGR